VASSILDTLPHSSSAEGTDAAAAAAATPAAGGNTDPAAAAVAAAAAALSLEQLAFDAAAGAAWVRLHTSLLQVLVQDVFSAITAVVFDTEAMRAAALRELRAATPVVDETTWPEAARRLLSATATATFLAQVCVVFRVVGFLVCVWGGGGAGRAMHAGRYMGGGGCLQQQQQRSL
jgi:hypothetical protein